jgi:hypothetical protein
MRWIVLWAATALAMGQGTEPKPKAEDYEVHGRSKEIAIGAEYMVHSFSGDGRTFIAKDFLIVEVALYPPKLQYFRVNEGAFALRINGQRAIAPVAGTMVASTLAHPDFNTGPHLEAGGGIGNTGVILGRPRPSDIPQAPGQRSPQPPGAPDPGPPGGIAPERRATAVEIAAQAALPEGEFNGPVSGFLYFPFKGKAGSIKSVELIYNDTILKLR